ncbi:MAG: PEP-utilizing enzyme [Agitococcus sp.]|nr:PEP-utilizing enzyme [Agitococcus sp.]
MTTATVTTATFCLKGPALTSRARERMCETDWRGALKLLMDSLEGMTYEQAISVLDGTCKLTGEGDTILMVEDDAEVRQLLQEQYQECYAMGGFLKIDNQMYQAYLVIDNLGPEDASRIPAQTRPNEAAERLVPHWRADLETVDAKSCWTPVYPHEVVAQRGLFYASNPKKDVAKLVLNAQGKYVIALFEKVNEGSTPFWMQKEAVTAQAAYESVAHYLRTHGNAQEFGWTHPSLAFNCKGTTTGRLSAAVLYESNTPKKGEAEIAEDIANEAALQEKRQKTFKAECIRLQQKIIDFADSDTEFGWQTYHWKSTNPVGTYLTIRVPRRALICYALSKTASGNLMPAYIPICPPDFKMTDDNPYHSDVWLGCGFAIDADVYKHDSPEYTAVLDLMFEVQKELLNFEVQVLARGAQMVGSVVFHDSPVIDDTCILVIPHAGVEFELQAMKAGAVICETGGRLAHLVTVCRESAKPIMRMDNALSTFKLGQSICLMPDQGKVEIIPAYQRNY